MKLLNRHRFKDQRGAAVVEFALVVPLLLVICFGIIEFSVLLYDKAMLTNASREGARAGIVYLPGRAIEATAAEKTAEKAAIYTTVKEVIEAYCQTHLVSFGNNSTALSDPVLTYSDPDTNGYDSGDSLTVTVNYQFQFLIFSNLVSMFGSGFGDGITLEAVTVMRLE